jgi:catechol 2,3-dioxygenase-like lactoylglutathione lyase family enzyme
MHSKSQPINDRVLETLPRQHHHAQRQRRPRPRFLRRPAWLGEIPKPEPLRVRGGVWFDAGGLDIHVSVEDPRSGPDAYRHFGLECADVEGLRNKLQSAGIPTVDGRPAPWKRFFVHDPFGNRIEIHESGGLRA